jgi:hypothetical protein
MILSKFRRNAGRKPRWNPEDIRLASQLQILPSNHDHQIVECHLEEAEEEILGQYSPAMDAERQDT